MEEARGMFGSWRIPVFNTLTISKAVIGYCGYAASQRYEETMGTFA